MNALRLYHDLKKRGILLEAAGDSLNVDAPTGALSREDRAALAECKPVLLGFLSRAKGPEGAVDDGRRFDARPSRYPGYTSVYDPIGDEWHDFPTASCLPSIVARAGKRNRGGEA